MSNIQEELAALRAQDRDALAAEVFVLRERLRAIRASAQSALARHERGDRSTLIIEVSNLSRPSDLLPENREPGESHGQPLKA